MKITCKYCGIVNKPHDCPHRNKYRNKDKNRRDTAIYNSSGYKREREETMNLYNNNCLWNMYVVGEMKAAETTHHIIEILEDESRATDIANLIPLTEDNHRYIHKLYKVNPNLKKVIQELLRVIKREYEEGNYQIGKYKEYVNKILSPLGYKVY